MQESLSCVLKCWNTDVACSDMSFDSRKLCKQQFKILSTSISDVASFQPEH